MYGHIQFGLRGPRGSCCSDWRHVFHLSIRVQPLWKETWTWILTMPSVTIDYAFIQWCLRYNHTDSDWDAWGRCGLTLWQVWRPRRQRQKWTDTVASVETKATETKVDWHCGKCGDQRGRDGSGLTLWQVWRPISKLVFYAQSTGTVISGRSTRQRQKWTDTVASVEANATETEGETETRPSSFFSRGGPEVSTQLTGKKQSWIRMWNALRTPSHT